MRLCAIFVSAPYVGNRLLQVFCYYLMTIYILITVLIEKSKPKYEKSFANNISRQGTIFFLPICSIFCYIFLQHTLLHFSGNHKYVHFCIRWVLNQLGIHCRKKPIHLKPYHYQHKVRVLKTLLRIWSECFKFAIRSSRQ